MNQIYGRPDALKYQHLAACDHPGDAVLTAGRSSGFLCLATAKNLASQATTGPDPQLLRTADRFLQNLVPAGQQLVLRCGDWLDISPHKFDPIFSLAALRYVDGQEYSLPSPQKTRWCQAWTNAGCPG